MTAVTGEDPPPRTAFLFRQAGLAQAFEVVKRMLVGETVNEDNSSLNKREWRELMAALGRKA